MARPRGRGVIGAISQPAAFINFLHGGVPMVPPNSNFNAIQPSGYPADGTMPSATLTRVLIPSSVTTSTQCVLKWTGTSGGLRLVNVTVVSGESFTVAGTTGSQASMIAVGTNGRIVFTFNAINANADGNDFQFYDTSSFSGINNIFLGRVSDEATWDAWLLNKTPEGLFSDEYADPFIDAGYSWFRPMGWMTPNEQQNHAHFYDEMDWQTSLSLRTGGTGRWIAGHWVGEITGTNDYECSEPSDWPAFVNGAPPSGTIVQGYMANTNTISTWLSLKVGDDIPRRIIHMSGDWPYITVAGTVASGDDYEVVFTGDFLPGGTVTVTAEATAATTSNAATVIAAAINAETDLSSNRVWAVASGAEVQIRYDARQGLMTFDASVVSGSSTVTESTSRFGQISTSGDQYTLNAGSKYTFIYDAWLNAWLRRSGGFGVRVDQPIALQVGFCNKCNMHLWITLPTHCTDAYVSSIIDYVHQNLNSDLDFAIEYSNEVWNNSGAFLQTSWASNRDAMHGEGGPTHFYALRCKQIFDIVDAYDFGSRNVYNVLACQAFGGTSGLGARFKGSTLVTSLVTPSGHAIYDEMVGQNYNSAPDRPQDKARVISYAMYHSGAQTKPFGYAVTNNSTDPTCYQKCGPTDATNYGLLGAADDYDSGDPDAVERALQWMDWDLREGIRCDQVVSSMSIASPGVVVTESAHGLAVNDKVAFIAYGGGSLPTELTAGKTYYVVAVPTTTQIRISETLGGSEINFTSAGTSTMRWGVAGLGSTAQQTLLGLRSGALSRAGIYGAFETYAAGEDSNRSSLSLQPLEIWAYEGGLEATYMTTSECTSFSISTDYGGSAGKIAALIEAYKNSDYAKELVVDQFRDFVSAGSHHKYPAQLILDGVNQWALFPAQPVAGSPYKTYDAARKWNKRRLTLSD